MEKQDFIASYMSFNFLRRSQRHWLKTDVKIKKKDVRPEDAAKKVYLLSSNSQSFCCCSLFFFPKNFQFFMYIL